MTAPIYRCIQCRTSLSHQLFKQKVWFRCRKCLSGFIPLDFMSAILPEFDFNKLCYEIRSGKIKSVRGCPCCETQMIKIMDVAGTNPIEACNSCQLVWLDPNEGEKIKKEASAQKTPRKIRIAAYDNGYDAQDELLDTLFPSPYSQSYYDPNEQYVGQYGPGPGRRWIGLSDILRFFRLEKLSEKYPTTAFLLAAVIVVFIFKALFTDISNGNFFRYRNRFYNTRVTVLRWFKNTNTNGEK